MTLLAFISAILFPWPMTVLIVLVSSFFVPLLPLAIGIFADALYYTPTAIAVPVFTLVGIVVTCVAFLVRSRLQTSTIGE
jgi:hypothetical protein